MQDSIMSLICYLFEAFIAALCAVFLSINYNIVTVSFILTQSQPAVGLFVSPVACSQTLLSLSISPVEISVIISTIIYLQVGDAGQLRVSHAIDSTYRFDLASQQKYPTRVHSMRQVFEDPQDYLHRAMSRVQYREEEYQSDCEEYERLFAQEYAEAVNCNKREIEEIPWDQIEEYVEQKGNRSEVVEDIVFDESLAEGVPEMCELQAAITELSSRFTHINVKELVQQLYEWMVQRKSVRQVFDSELLCSTYSQYSEQNRRREMEELLKLNSPDFSEKYAIKDRIIVTEDQGPILTNKGLVPVKQPLLERHKKVKSIKDYRMIEREVGAKAFCDRGYGIPKLREEILESKLDMKIDENRYKAVSCAFVTDAWRRMEKYLIEQCNNSLKVASSHQLKCLYTILLNCRDNFSEEEARTFVKFVKLAYGLGEVEINEQQTLKLYSKFMVELQRKAKQLKFSTQLCRFMTPKQNQSITITSSKLNLEDLWTPQNQNEFYEAYLKCKSISGVREYFRDKFSSPEFLDNPGNKKKLGKAESSVCRAKSKGLALPFNVEPSYYQHLTDFRILNSKFHKTIRSGLRKIESYSRANLNDLPHLYRVSDDVIKSMFGSAEGGQARAAIFEVQRLNTCDIKAVTNAINAINEFNDKKTDEKKRIMSKKKKKMFDYCKS